MAFEDVGSGKNFTVESTGVGFLASAYSTKKK